MTPPTQEEEKEYTVRTYYYPEDRLVLAYTTYQGPETSHERVYKVTAKTGMEAKSKAIKMRKKYEQSKQAEGVDESKK